MASQNPRSMRSLFIQFIQDREEKYSVIHVFTDAEKELKLLFPQFFTDAKQRYKALRAYSTACSAVRKKILQANVKIKTKQDVQSPQIQKIIKEQMASSPTNFTEGGHRKTIVLQLQNKDKVFFKVGDDVIENLKEFIRYWSYQAVGQERKAMATKAFFTVEMVEEYYRIFSEEKKSKKDNATKLMIYKLLEKMTV